MNRQNRSFSSAVFLIVAFFLLSGCRNEGASTNSSSVKDVPVGLAATNAAAYRVVVIGSDGVQKQIGVLAPGDNKTFGFQYSLTGAGLTIGTGTKPAVGTTAGGDTLISGRTDPNCLYPNDPSCTGGGVDSVLGKKSGIKDQCITGNEPGCKPPTIDK